MAMVFSGKPSDDLPEVLATGTTDVSTVFVSLSARAADGRDADYIEWHSLDHRPEQYRVAGLRHAQRLVSTPACRAARAADDPRFTAVDHVMSYFFADDAALAPFAALGAALRLGGRMPLRLPSVELGVFQRAGMVAAPRVVVGADVVPWRPTTGAYLLIEEGGSSPVTLVDTPGVTGAWWLDGREGPAPFDTDHRGLQLTYLFLDDDPVAVAERLRAPLQARWHEHGARPLLAAPFHEVVPNEWGRHLP
ncbi:MAG: hypothetical protein R2707_05325 [Acidimicrobiales bacterium]